MTVTLDLKTLNKHNAGIGRYSINLTSHLLKRKKYQYIGIMCPESNDSLIDIEKKNYFKRHVLSLFLAFTVFLLFVLFIKKSIHRLKIKL